MINALESMVPQNASSTIARTRANPIRFIDMGIAICLVVLACGWLAHRWNRTVTETAFPQPLPVPRMIADDPTSTPVPRHPGNPIAESCLRQGMQELQRGNANNAETWFLKAQATDPQHPKFTLALERFKRFRREQEAWNEIQKSWVEGNENLSWQTFAKQSRSRSFFQQWALPMVRNLEQRERNASAAVILQTWLNIHPHDTVAAGKLERILLALGFSRDKTWRLMGDIRRDN